MLLSKSAKYIKSIISIVLFRGTSAVSILFLYYIISHTYENKDAAKFFLITAASGVATPILLQGYNTFVTKWIARSNRTEDQLGIFRFTMSVIVRRLIAIFLALALTIYFGIKTFGIDPDWYFSLFAIVVVVPVFSLFGFTLQGLKAYNFSIAVLGILNNLILATAIFLIDGLGLASDQLANTSPHVLFLASALTTLVVSSVILAFAFSRHDTASPGPNDIVRHEQIFDTSAKSEAHRFWLVSALVAAINWSPQLVYFIWATPEQYAQFSVAHRVANVITFLIIISNFFLAPVASSLHHAGDLQELRRVFINLTRVIGVLCVPPAAAIVIFPETVMSVFGASYAAGAPVLAILVLAQTFSVMMGSTNTLLNMCGYERELIRSMAVAIAIGAITLSVLGPGDGGVGVAYSFAATLIVQNILAAWETNRRLRINVLKVFWK